LVYTLIRKFHINLDEFLENVKNYYPYHSFKESNYLVYKKKFQTKVSKLINKKIIKFLYNNRIIKIPNISFGNINTLNLFEYDEIILFLFYKANKWKYVNAIDIGANIGLHSIILSSLNFKVKSFEPDPKTFLNLKKIIKLNNCNNVKINKRAISEKDKTVVFNRIINNLTGSHISGSKDYLYGPVEQFNVKAETLNKHLDNKKTIIKIDAEGQEAKIINSINKKFLKNVDIICEINNKKNAILINSFCKKMKLKMYTQKINWKMCKKINELPVSYKEGSVFISYENKPFGL
jgi:FkbM family methyltransferase